MTEKKYVINPKSNRSLLVGGNLWLKLVKEGVLQDDASVKHPKELYRIKDNDSYDKINELKNELKTDEYFAVKGRGHRLEKKLMKRFKGKSQPVKPKKEKPVYKIKEQSDSESDDSSSGGDWENEIAEICKSKVLPKKKTKQKTPEPSSEEEDDEEEDDEEEDEEEEEDETSSDDEEEKQ